MTLGKKLRNLRNQKKLTQEEIVFELNVAQSSYSDWENDISIPKKINLNKIANYYEIDVRELVDEVYNITIKNKENAIALVNSPNSKINSTEAIIKISNSLEKLTLLLENY